MSVLWSDRDHSTCVYPVAGLGRHTLICAAPSAGFYCEPHAQQIAHEIKRASGRTKDEKRRDIFKALMRDAA